MRKLILLLLLLTSSLMLAQSTGNYTYSTSTTGSLVLDKDGNSIDMTTGTTSLYGPNVDIYTATVQNLGFDFVFMGTIYNQFSVSPDGGLRFGSTAITGHTYSPAANTPIISLTNIDNKTGVGTGSVRYKVQAGTGGQVLIVEWKDILINWNATGTTLSTFQLRLYQATGEIEMVYGQMWNSSTSAQSGVIWFGSSNTSGTVGQLNTITTTPTYNSTATSLTTTSFTASSAMTNLHSTSDGSRRVFTFTPPAAPADPTGLSFTGVTASQMTLNWTDNATTETGYAIYRSLDNVTFTLVATLAANSISYTATGLTPSTTYYWRVFAINEGRLSNALSGSQATNAPSLSGTKTIGASGDYPSLTAAIADVQSQGLAGALVLEFLSDYAGGETFPITFTNLTTTATNTLTVRPQSGVTGISISGSNTTAIIRIVNEDYVFIDGRPGGSGTDREITITNTGAGPTILFIDDATNNTVRYCNVVGSANTSNTSGVIFFSTTANTTGNDNNTIEYCDINALGSAVGIYSAGTTGKDNNDNSILNNRIRNFYIDATSTTSTYGIRIHSNSTNFIISGNSLYQELPRAYSSTAAIHYGISVTTGNGHTISNNFIGGSDVNCGGSAYIFSTGSGRFWAIETTTGTAANPISIQGNTIANFNINSGFTSVGSTLFGGMVITGGATNVGTTTGNIIGSTSATSITVNLTGGAAGPLIVGIATTGGTPHNIYNNTIAGITVTATSGTAYGNLYAIALGSSGSVTIVDGNTIGSASGTLDNNSGSGAVTTQYVTAGIRVTAGSGTTGITINNNIIQYMNMPAGASNTGATLYGLQLTSTGTVYTITNNTIRNLTTGSARTSGTTSASLIGINHQGTTSPTIIRGNTVHSLSQTAATAGVVVYGILASGATSGNFELSGNFVHSISLATTSTSAFLEGIYFVSGVYRVFNNMVRLGIDAAGNSVSGNFSISGIRKATTSNQTIVFNSVFIGGTVSSSSVNTFGLRRTAVGSSDSIYNNILVNNRSNSGGTARHYAISTSSTSGLEDYNLFFANGSGGAVGSVNDGTTPQTTLANYQTAFAGRNLNSAYYTPNYVNATGDASAVDLHVQSPTAAEGWGSTAFNYITTDFDGGTRSSLTPVDVGADAGNYVQDDIFPPSITYTALNNTASTSNRTLASVTITDYTGVPTSGTLQPRIWFRRSAPTASSWGSTQGSLQSGSGTNGVWNFLIDYSVLGITPSVGETYQYYVVAQDLVTTPNIGTNPAGGVHTDVNNQTSAPSTPNSYNILNAVSGSYNVGTGETFTTLTGASGFFKFVNDNVVTGNVTVNITSDLTEDGTHGLNQWVEDAPGGFTMLIQSSAATERLISGAVTNGMIRLNGADRVTIDGRVSGSGKYLRFRNTNTSNPTITFINDASDNTIRDCYIEGATTSTSNGVVFISTGATTGNDNNMIRDCIIRDRSDAAGVPANLVYSAGTSASITNTGNTLLNNEMFNFTARGIQITSTGNENWTIQGNEIYQSSARTTTIYGIDFNSIGTSNLITQNTIRDMNTNAEFRGINLTDARNTTVSRNKINQTSVNGSTSIWTGIYFAGSSGNPASVTLVNNQITIIPATSSSQTIRGIYDFGYTGNTINAFYNSVYIGGTATGTATWAYVRGTSTPTTTNIRNNAFVNNRSGGSVNHFAMGDQSEGSGTFTVSNNFYSGLGTTPANFMDRGTSSSGTPESFSAWRTNKSDNYSYGEIATSVNYGNLFTNVSNGDLSILTSNEECWLLNGKGQPISTVNNDYAGNSRSTSIANGATDIGAFEFSTTVVPPSATQSGTIGVGNTTTYSVSGTQTGSIYWVSGTGLPTSITFRYYSGTPATYSGTQPRINAYWDVTQTGGTDYTYNITFIYDEAQLGNIDENNLVPAKSDDGGNTWTPFTVEGTGAGQFQRNTTANTITLYGMTSFSMFTLGDEFDPLPVQLSAFTVSTKGRDVILNWTTATEINSAGFEIERKLISQEKAQTKWENVGFVRGNGNSNRPIEYTFTDMKLNTGKYAYRLKMIDNDGSFAYSDEVQVEIGKPDVTKIEQNYPNAFNPATKIEYQLANPSKVVIEVYNITGEKITELVNSEQVEGYYSLVFDASKYGLASGIYFYRMIAMDRVTGKNVVQTKKMLYLK